MKIFLTVLIIITALSIMNLSFAYAQVRSDSGVGIVWCYTGDCYPTVKATLKHSAASRLKILEGTKIIAINGLSARYLGNSDLRELLCCSIGTEISIQLKDPILSKTFQYKLISEQINTTGTRNSLGFLVGTSNLTNTDRVNSQAGLISVPYELRAMAKSEPFVIVTRASVDKNIEQELRTSWKELNQKDCNFTPLKIVFSDLSNYKSTKFFKSLDLDKSRKVIFIPNSRDTMFLLQQVVNYPVSKNHLLSSLMLMNDHFKKQTFNYPRSNSIPRIDRPI